MSARVRIRESRRSSASYSMLVKVHCVLLSIFPRLPFRLRFTLPETVFLIMTSHREPHQSSLRLALPPSGLEWSE